MTIDLYRTPLLTARETARHLKMPESTLNVWLSVGSDKPLVHAVRPERRGWPRVPFVRSEFDDPYALAKQRIATDGVAVFVRLADKSLIRARDHQHAIKDVLANHLHDIDWDDTGTAIRLRLHHYPSSAEVVIDPRFGWGSPVLTANKVKIEDVVALWRTGEPIKAVAEEYDLTETVVEDVLRQAA